MGVLIYDIIINNQKFDDIYITGPDVDMSDQYINCICKQTIKDTYKNDSQLFKWKWKS